MRRMMGQLKLTVNEEKTRTCRSPEEEFDFLGIHLRSAPRGENQTALYRCLAVAEEHPEYD